jgi:general secretion pathway protein E/type IV pilus assembly protein PilB
VTSNDKYVIEILLENGLLLPDQIEKARASIVKEGVSTLDVLVENGAITEPEVLAVLARQFGMEQVSLRDLDLPPEVRDSIPGEVARKYRVVPIYRADDVLTVALSDPLDVDNLDTLRYLLKCSVEAVVASRDEIQVALNKFYPSETDVNQVLDKMPDSAVDVALTSTSALVPEEAATDADAPIIKLVTLIIVEAYRHRASDIHLEPMEKRFRVRYRIDGALHEVDSPPKRLQPAITSRVKIMAGMKISEKRLPQDGRIQVNIMGRELDLRVSTVPASHGEAVVMRILDKQSLALGLPNLGFFSDDQQLFEQLIQLPDGILLITGPTGSGKTTTLYACLNYINRPDRKIITVEDPVEYQLSGVNQVQVREDIGMTFAHALRSILRQAPNIVMIGEIRDKETASIATEASLTGHLVFSTLHTNDAPSAVTRLLDIGVKPFLVASSLRAVMAQRLVRCVCDNCKETYAAPERELRLLGPAAKLMTGSALYRGRGCNKCSLTGYYGRKGIFEIFTVTEEIQRMIYNKVPSTELRVRARENGMRTLREDGLRKTAAGVTTIEEVMRNTMGDLD